jgi:transposase
VDGIGGLVGGAGAPAFCWSPEKGGSASWPSGPARARVALTEGEALGRSRGGLSTKIHLAVDGKGRPLSVLLTGGQAGDSPQLLPALDAISIRGPGGGRPRKRPGLLLADKGYAHDSTRAALRRRRIRHAIPERSDQAARRAAKGARGGRPPDFDQEAYKQRNVVERCFGRLKQWRDLATRYAKRAAIYRASLVLIAALIWLT